MSCNKLRVAYQGEPGAFSEIAAENYFAKKADLHPCYSFSKVFEKVKNGDADFGILPVENSLYGIVFETFDLLAESKLKIFGEVYLKINHYLLAEKKYKLQKIEKIYSHPQALGQCSNFLKSLKEAEIHPSFDTAGSVIYSKQSSNCNVAIIASKKAAEIHSLKILKNKIQNNESNYTRFLVISKKSYRKKIVDAKSTISFELPHVPGALYKALSVFALREIDLLKIESRPIPQKRFQYRFYADLRGNLSEKKITNSLKQLSEFAHSILKFGSYDSGKYYSS